jgi:Putative metallopeptidase family (DUF6782)
MVLLRLTSRPRAVRLVLVGLLAFPVLAGSTAAEISRVATPVSSGLVGDGLPGLEPGRAARIAQLIVDPAHACLPAATAARAAGGGQPAVAQAARALRASPVGAWLLDEAARQGVLICLDPATQLAAYYRAQLRLIGLQAALPPAARTLFLAHELAHVPQHPNYSNNRDFAVDDLILLHRLREASAEAIATRVLWQMQRRGDLAAWRAKLETGYGDIARAFAVAMAGAAVDDTGELRATRAAFDQWFAWPLRLQQYDGHIIDHLERIARDRMSLVPPRRRLTDDFLRGIARHAGETFLSVGDRPLTDVCYRGGLSNDNAARLAALLDAGTARLSGAAAALRTATAGPPGH